MQTVDVRHNAADGASGDAPPAVHDVVGTVGRPLDPVSWTYFESWLRTDLSDVRIHDDTQAAMSANAVGADAFTVGNHVAFAHDRSGDRSLLAHELAHVVQQRRGRDSMPREPHTLATLQRAPQGHGIRAPAGPSVDDRAAGLDVSYALDYIEQFYQGVHLSIEQVDKVRDRAQKNYEDFGKLKDPPSLSYAIVKALFSSALALIPGGKIIAAGLEFGIFASELGRLKLELEEDPIPGVTIEDERRRGPSAETMEKAAKGAERVKVGWETGEKVYEAVKETLEKRVEAAKAESEALESAHLGQERIADWSKATGRAQREQISVTEWIKRAGEKKRLRGRMLAAVEERLGPIPVVDEKWVEPFTKHYELELYRMKYKAEGSYVQTVIDSVMGTGGHSPPSEPELRVPGGLSQATRRRIAWCAGLSASDTDDEMMAMVLHIPLYTVHQMPQLRPG